ncbi:MAG: hypothetical protein LBD97_00765 [Bifidobacteriaceae bacterium]|jgi:hypothetical protein|nr:hypothetical protein [Bifidobacteriaceae bacterium]
MTSAPANGAALARAKDLIADLRLSGVSCVLYGSRGVALHLGGPFRQLGDTDLLVDDAWLAERWQDLQSVMAGLGYRLTDQAEREFSDAAGNVVAFAAVSALVQDGIVQAIGGDDLVMVDGVRTLSLPAFQRPYEFSARDGYRRDQRNKNDAEVIALIRSEVVDAAGPGGIKEEQ